MAANDSGGLRGRDVRAARRQLLALGLMLAGATSVACFWVSSVSDHLMFRLILAAAVLATSLTSTAFLALGREKDPGFGASRIPRKPRRFGDGKTMRLSQPPGCVIYPMGMYP